jgi:hypothetical protein
MQVIGESAGSAYRFSRSRRSRSRRRATLWREGLKRRIEERAVVADVR